MSFLRERAENDRLAERLDRAIECIIQLEGVIRGFRVELPVDGADETGLSASSGES